MASESVFEQKRHRSRTLQPTGAAREFSVQERQGPWRVLVEAGFAVKFLLQHKTRSHDYCALRTFQSLLSRLRNLVLRER